MGMSKYNEEGNDNAHYEPEMHFNPFFDKKSKPQRLEKDQSNQPGVVRKEVMPPIKNREGRDPENVQEKTGGESGSE